MKLSNKLYLAAFLSVLMLSCGSKKKEDEKVIRPVRYQEVGYLGGDNTRTFSGTSKTDEVVNLSFRNGGIITTFDISLGQQVKKGQLLATLDNVQARLNYENAVSAQNSAASQMNTAKLSLDRVRSLYEKGSSSLSEYESAKNSYRTAKASYESAERSVAIQREQILYGYLYTPADGIIAAVNSEINENVSAGQNIAVLNVSGDMEIALGLPEAVINNVKQGMSVRVSFSSLPGESFEGKVSEVSPSVDSNTSTYPIRVIVMDPSDAIKSGMAANVTFDFATDIDSQGALIVPAIAVGEDGDGRFVFVIEDANGMTVVKKQMVQTGALTSAGFEIRNGLTAGQRVATAGLQTLLDGQEVRLQ
jgi:RND family efflux transporter MFP subunit